MQNSWFYINLYELNGIPEGLAVSATIVSFLIACAPFLGGRKVFGTEFPELSGYPKFLCAVLGPVILLLLIFGFQKSWHDNDRLFAAQPHCFIEVVWVDENSFDLNWYSASDSDFSTRLIGPDGLEGVSSDGTRRISWDFKFAELTHEVTARNRFGQCRESATAWNPTVDWEQPLTCHLWIDRETARPGEEYRLEWSVGAPELAFSFINGKQVEHKGHAIFNFSGPNYDRFRLVVNSGGNTCEANVRVLVDNL